MNSSSWLRSFRPSISPPHQSRIARRGNQQAMTFSTTPTVSMTNSTNRVEIITSVQRRNGVAPNQLFTWRRLLTAAGSGEEVVPASDYRALQNQVRELHRLLGKKTLEAEVLKEALEHATGSKKQLRLPPSPPKDGSR